MVTTRGRSIGAAAGRGVVAGLAGAAFMTLGEKLEQKLTGRANSYVPARAVRAAVGMETSDTAKPMVANHAMHWATAGLLGAVRGVWSALGIRGAEATATHTVVRLAFDQTLENLTGVGAPPATWPAGERAVDVLHKGVYAVATGLVADAWIDPVAESRRGRTSH